MGYPHYWGCRGVGKNISIRPMPGPSRSRPATCTDVMDLSFLNGKTVLVTGGTGTFGRAFIKRALQVPGIKKIIVFSRDELKQSEVQASYPGETRLRYFLGDIRSRERLTRAFRG